MNEEIKETLPQVEELPKAIPALDYTLTPEERVKRVEEIIAALPPHKLTPYYIDKVLVKYLTEPLDKKERKEKYILTDNHMKNINDRETSFEGLAGRLENGEDGIYNMIANDKNIRFTHSNSKYTQEDIERIPQLKEYMEEIKKVDEQFKQATGKRRYLLKKQLIEMHKDKYEIGKAYTKPIYMMHVIKSLPRVDLDEHITIDEEGNVNSDGLISLTNPKHVSLLLCNYSSLKQESWDKFNSDIKWLMEDLDALVEKSLREDHPLLYDLLIYKIDGKSNAEIQSLLGAKHKVRHTPEYLSALWRNKIPQIIADQATEDWIDWHFLQEEKGKYKRCSRCGQIKLAMNRYFSKNNTSKDGYYSICKECRNKKKK